MINGHGDDIFSYPGIRHNFSSNIVCRRDLDALYEHINCCMPRISSYPEPDASSLAVAWAASMGISAHNLCVTNGATARATHRYRFPHSASMPMPAA